MQHSPPQIPLPHTHRTHHTRRLPTAYDLRPLFLLANLTRIPGIGLRLGRDFKHVGFAVGGNGADEDEEEGGLDGAGDDVVVGGFDGEGGEGGGVLGGVVFPGHGEEGGLVAEGADVGGGGVGH